MKRCRLPVRDDEGAVLVLVLLFMLVIGATTAAVVTQATASLSNTAVVRNKASKVYTSDTGIDVGIQRLRQDPTLCANPGQGSMTIPNLDASVVPGPGGAEPTTPDLRVTCQALSGSAVGANGYAVMTTDTTSTDSLTTQGGSVAPIISGPIYVGGWKASGSGQVNLKVQGGDALESPNGGRCTGASSQPNQLVVAPTPPFRYRCFNPAGFSSPTALADAVGHELPDWSSLFSRAIGPMAPPVSRCAIFRPGSYISTTGVQTLPLDRDNYFASGVYYFEDVVINVDASLVTGNAISVVGGAPGPEDTRQNTTGGSPTAACGTDLIAGVTDGSTGVTWILGKGSRVLVGGGNSQLELFTHTGGTSGTQGLSVLAVPSGAEATAGAAWKRSSVSYSSNQCAPPSTSGCLLYQASGSNNQASMQGLVWAPLGHVRFNNTSNTQGAKFAGGIVAGRLDLQASSSASGLAVSIRSKPGRRVVKLTSEAGDGGTQGRRVTATTVVRLENDTVATSPTFGTTLAEILSWRSD